MTSNKGWVKVVMYAPEEDKEAGKPDVEIEQSSPAPPYHTNGFVSGLRACWRWAFANNACSKPLTLPLISFCPSLPIPLHRFYPLTPDPVARRAAAAGRRRCRKETQPLL